MTKTLLGLAFMAQMTIAGAEEGWFSLFDGETLQGWKTAKGEDAREGGWVAADGVLHRKSKGGDLYLPKEYGDFEFRWEWKISPKGNSGVKYRVTSYGKDLLGPEYQVLDDEHRDGKGNVKRRVASLYDLFATNDKTKIKPVGEWNSSRIVAKGKHFQHYLNGELVVDVVAGSPEWIEALQKSKFKNRKDFAMNPTGRIFLQDHGDEVWYRNLAIQELKTTK